MNSGNQSNNQAPLAVPPQAPPSFQEINRGLLPGKDPLDFIKSNLRPAPQQPAPPSPVDIIINSSSAQLSEPSLPVTPSVPPQEEVVQSRPDHIEKDPEPQTTEEEGSEIQESFRGIRKKLTHTENTLKEKETLIENLTRQVEESKKSTEEVQRLKDRIDQLEKYETIVSLKTSPQYVEKYVKPIEETKGKLQTLAKEYEIPAKILEDATRITSKRELNQYLGRYFDELGASEARGLIESLRSQQLQAQQAEEQPKQTLEQINNEIAQRTQAEEAQRGQKIATSAQEGYVEALQELQNEGKYPELVIRDGDEKHNSYSKPIINNAAAEYGKFVKLLHMVGGKDLPKEAAKIIAKRFLLAESALVMAESRAQMYDQTQNLLNSVKKNARFNRPAVGGTVSATSAPVAPSRPQSPEQAADVLLNNVLRK